MGDLMPLLILIPDMYSLFH